MNPQKNSLPQDEPQTNPKGILIPIVQLTDTTGNVTNTFHSGENFLISFTLTNTTDKNITYGMPDCRPPVIFKVFKGDSIIASSVDGQLFPQEPYIEHIEPGGKLVEFWKGPTTSGQKEKVVLNQGKYEIQIIYPSFFEEVEVKEVLPIELFITE